MIFEIHTYGADTPHRGDRYLPLKIKAQTQAEAEQIAHTARPQSHPFMCIPIDQGRRGKLEVIGHTGATQ